MAKKKQDDPNEKSVCLNKKARHDYEILDTLEAGLVLTGSEVKSLREGNASLTGAFVKEKKGELYLEGAEIQPYSHASIKANHTPLRSRKLLCHRTEIDRMIKSVNTKGTAIVALKIYFTRGKAKVQIGLGRGKKLHDKRADKKARDVKRGLDRLTKRSR